MPTTTGWTTVAAYDTPFLADLVVDHLADAGIPTRVLNDSAGGNLPHISFGTGGYRVQVPADDAELARASLRDLPEDGVGDLDVGTFADPDGAQPPGTGPQGARRREGSAGPAWSRRGVLLVALLAIMATLLVTSGVILFGPSA